MFQVFRNAWMDTQLRKKILYTLFIIILFRLGSNIFVPFLNNDAIQTMTSGASLLNYLDVMTGGSLGKGTLLAMSITPYINASIIIQLLAVAIPPLEKLQKEGEQGRKKLNTITKITSLAIAVLQAISFYIMLRNGTTVDNQHVAVLKYGDVNQVNPDMFSVVLSAIVIVACFVAGASMIIWLGDRINEKGIGNGISIILFAGILSRVPSMVSSMISGLRAGTLAWWAAVLVVLGILALIVLITWVNGAERRIPVQYAKRQVGRKMYGGQASTLPMKVNMSGVLPIIFAQSIAMIPSTIAAFCKQPAEGTFWYGFLNAIDTKSVLYMIFYFLMIIAFSYFYATIQFNPVEISNNLKKNGGFIPGFRPGKPTTDFIKKVLNKVTLFGAIYLGVVAILPLLIGKIVGNSSLSIGGTSVIIVVGVALETVQALESQMLMRQYKGFLE